MAEQTHEPDPAADYDDGDWQVCDCCWGEGEIDDHDEDPINSPPGSFYTCPECNGTGGYRVPWTAR
jgi:DnaJ-class molecular chaperone